jgi:flagellar hook protein FlgE
MLRSLFSGISGLRAHQQMMDVTGNNIANVNTVGFKSSSIIFEDTLSQIVKGATAPQGGNGGTNPAQIGLGVQLGTVTKNFSQGGAQTTGRNTDVMIQGDGFFAVKSSGETLYTRNGSFTFDTTGRLVTSSGAVVQGWPATNGVSNTNGPTSDIIVPAGMLLPPSPTTGATVGGNLSLPADAPSGASIVASVLMYDANGGAHSVRYTYTKTAPTTWDLKINDGTTDATGALLPDETTATLTFSAAGKLTSPTAPATVTMNQPSWGTGTLDIDVSGLTAYMGDKTVDGGTQIGGAATGSLQSFNLAPDGTLVGIFSNGLKQPLAQLALANFNNPPGLEAIGGSLYRGTVNSGNAQLGTPGSAGRGVLASGQVEMSNVDLAAEFTNLIVAQRGFQANSKVITTSDEILQSLVNMKN